MKFNAGVIVRADELDFKIPRGFKAANIADLAVGKAAFYVYDENNIEPIRVHEIVVEDANTTMPITRIGFHGCQAQPEEAIEADDDPTFSDSDDDEDDIDDSTTMQSSAIEDSQRFTNRFVVLA